MKRKYFELVQSSTEQNYPYFNQFIVKSKIQDNAFEEWVTFNMQGFQDRLTVFKIRKLSHQIINQSIEEFLLELIMRKFKFNVIKFEVDQKKEASTIHFAKSDSNKLQLLEALKCIKISNISCKKKCVPVEIQNTDRLLSFLMKTYPQCFKDYFRSFMQFLMIEKRNQDKKYIKYCSLQESIQRLQQSIEYCKNSTSKGDLIITNQQKWINFLIKAKTNVKSQHRFIAQLLNSVDEQQIQNSKSLIISSFLQQKQICDSNQSHYKFFSRRIMQAFGNKILCRNYQNVVGEVSNILKSVSKFKQISLALKNYGLRLYNQRILIRYFCSTFQQRLYSKKAKIACEKKIESVFVSIKMFYHTQKSKKLINLETIKEKLKGFAAAKQYENMKTTYNVLMLQKLIKGFLVKQRTIKQLNNQYFSSQKQLRMQQEKDCSELVEKINCIFQRSFVHNKNQAIQCQMAIISICFPSFESLIPFSKIEQFMNNISTIALQSKSAPVKLQASNTEIKAYYQNGKSYRYSIQTQQEQIQQVLGRGKIGIRNLPRQKNIFQSAVSDDQRFAFILDSQKRLYGLGQNSFGQLGMGNIKQIKQFRKVPIRQKIKALSTRNKRTLCLTQDQKLYYFGVYNDRIILQPISIRPNFVPKNTKIQSVCCSTNKDYLLLSNGEILQISVIKSKVLNRIVLNKNKKRGGSKQKNFVTIQPTFQGQQFEDNFKSFNTTKCSIKSLNSSKNQFHSKNKNSSRSNQPFIPDLCLLDVIGGPQFQIVYSRKIKINSFDQFRRKQIVKWLKQKPYHNTIEDQSFLMDSMDEKENVKQN